MSKMKPHWPTRINPPMELRAAKRWLELGIGQDRGGSVLKPDIFRVLSILEAITIIDNALDLMKLEDLNESLRRSAAEGRD